MKTSLQVLVLVVLLGLTVFGQQNTSPVTPDSPNDPFLWLEDNNSSRTWEWRLAQSEKTRVAFDTAEMQQNQAAIDSLGWQDDPIPFLEKIGEYYYGFWYDGAFRNGALRRTTLEELKKPQPDWEIVFDGDRGTRFHPLAIGFSTMECLRPSFERCMFFFSPTGSDTTVGFEYDLSKQRFVVNGFALPEARGGVYWLDADTLLVARTQNGLTTASGYASGLREWKRGTPFSSAKIIYTAKQEDLGIWVGESSQLPLVRVSLDFYNRRYYVKSGEQLQPLDVPTSASIDFYQQSLLIHLKQDWSIGGITYKTGTLLQTDLNMFLSGQREFKTLFTPTQTRFLTQWITTEKQIVLNILEDVRSQLHIIKPDGSRQVVAMPFVGSYSFASTSQSSGDEFLIAAEGYFTPETWFLVSGQEVQQLRQSNPRFETTSLQELRFVATSKDGTRIPYTVLASQGLKFDGKNPTLLYGYGGFELSILPYYNVNVGKLWLERGGVYVEANIRGGGEFGADWHKAALRENRQRAFDDFIAVAEDLVARKITSPEHLGIRGGSNGGLLVGAVMLQRPDLFKAVVCAVPLLDMRRYNKLLVGSSWMAEYGNPDDPKDWAFMGKYSPYQNVLTDKKYPKLLLLSSSTDDRVHPAHARKMAALMQSLGYDVMFHETYSGGHGNSQYQRALTFTFLWQHLK